MKPNIARIVIAAISLLLVVSMILSLVMMIVYQV